MEIFYQLMDKYLQVKGPPNWVALSDIYALGVQYPVLGMVSRYAWYSAIASGV